MTENFFLKEVIDKIENKDMIDIFKKYLSNEDVCCSTLQLIIKENEKLKKHEDIFIEAHKLFVASQRMLDDLACKDITPYENRDMDVVMCFTFYAGVCTILKKHLPEDLCEKILDIYEEANLRMNVPRDNEEENEVFFLFCENILRNFMYLYV
ncbi:hypothetical protein NCER_102159 [Vairimorpha ceranae BRL01]|uniref:Uncharacterized protein n=1 Tax=Vairimorpha ceranae (strain BRL01) TaxID=578460 RepID=C4VBI6_VAIC1|nr:hypothetical protein NCER_102159 [Vairimorpha ceranae BRL01]